MMVMFFLRFRALRIFVVAAVLCNSPTRAMMDPIDDGNDRLLVSDERSFWGKGRIRYTYDPSMISPCNTIIMIGVGTAMSVNDYMKLSRQIATGHNLTFMLMDHNPNHIIKYISKQYSSLANYVAQNIDEILPEECAKFSVTPDFMIGGHSAGGQAALQAYEQGLLGFKPLAFVGLDPWFAFSTQEDHVNDMWDLPALYWGYSARTCAVDPRTAAAAFYNISDTWQRVLYQIQNSNKAIQHCAFCDHGCLVVCPTSIDGDWIYPAVGESTQLFVEALRQGNKPFRRSHFELTPIPESELQLFMNNQSIHFDEERTQELIAQ